MADAFPFLQNRLFPLHCGRYFRIKMLCHALPEPTQRCRHFPRRAGQFMGQLDVGADRTGAIQQRTVHRKDRQLSQPAAVLLRGSEGPLHESAGPGPVEGLAGGKG